MAAGGGLGKVHARGPLGLCWGYIGIMEKKMESTGTIEIIRGSYRDSVGNI